MAKDKESFVLYRDLIHTVRKLSKQDAGELFIHILEYVNDENPVTDNPFVDLAFEPIKQSLKRDLKKYIKTCERNAKNGAKGGRPKKPKQSEKTHSVILKPKKADSDSDSDSVNDILNWSELLLFINKKTNRGFKVINKSAKSSYIARLKEGYTKDDIRTAIENACNNQHHKENNYQYLTPEFFSRSSTLDKYSGTTKAIDPLVEKVNELRRLNNIK